MASERSNDLHGTKREISGASFPLPMRGRHSIANSDKTGGVGEGLPDSGAHSRKKRRQDSAPRDVNPRANENKKPKKDHVKISMNRYDIENRDNFLIIRKDLFTQENLAPLKDIESTRNFAEELESLHGKIKNCDDFAILGQLFVRVVRLREALAEEQKVNSQVPEFWGIED